MGSAKGKMGLWRERLGCIYGGEMGLCLCVYGDWVVCVWRLGCVCGEVVEEGDMFGWMRRN